MVTAQQIEGLRPMLFAVACRQWRVGSEDAEDAAQNVVVRLWQRAQSIRPESLGPYALRALSCEMIDRRRLANRRPEVLECEMDEDLTGLADLLADPSSVAEYQTVHEDLRGSRAYRALLDLDPRLAEAVFAIDVAEVGYDELARRTGVKVGTLRSRVFRGREILRTVLN